MILRSQLPPVGVDQASSWPYDSNNRPWRASTKGSWKLLMDAGGLLVVWSRKTDNPEPEGFIEFARAQTKAQALSFITMFCSLGYQTAEQIASETGDRSLVYATTYQTGRIYGFNWISGTVAQINMASHVARRFFEGDVDGAWEYGRAFEKLVEAKMAELV